MRRSHLAAGAALAVGAALLGLDALDRRFPPDLGRAQALSTVVVDRAGLPLRIFRAADGVWRLPIEAADVAPGYVELLVALEDRRFWWHPGVDPLALARASIQAATNGRIVSGASTLTMQVARLLEPQPRTLRAKLGQMARALQLERRLTKPEILGLYLTLAPMGGNLEGVRAGSLAWLGKEPRHLSDAEAALLVALPQSPTRRRPDLALEIARAARDQALARGEAAGVLESAAAASARLAPLPHRRHAMPRLAPHLGERLAASSPGTLVRTTLDAKLQGSVQRMLADEVTALPAPVNLAALLVDHRTGELRAWAGSADYGTAGRAGMNDLARTVRSPGSALKPFVYGLAFERLRAHPASLVPDRPTRFDGYAPGNFAGGHDGEVTVKDALQRSLNLPAVLVLERVGPVALLDRFKAAGLDLALEEGSAPALPMVLGGVGTSLFDLVSAYGALAGRGQVTIPLVVRDGGPLKAKPLLDPAAAAAVRDILAGIPPPPGAGAEPGRIAYKTGTSHRFRDGWAVGFDGRHLAGVWVGRADGGSCDACSGRTAAGVLFKLMALVPPTPLPPRATDGPFAGAAPPALARLSRPGAPVRSPAGPRIAFPLAGTMLLVDRGGGEVGLAAEGGARPYRWLIDGTPIDAAPWRRRVGWRPREPGFVTLTLLDAQGRSDAVQVRVVERAAPLP